MANFMLSTITCKQTIIECFATDQEGKQKICDALDSGSALERYFVKKNLQCFERFVRNLFNIWRGLFKIWRGFLEKQVQCLILF